MERRPAEAMCRLRCAHEVCALCLPQLQIGRCPICRERIHPAEAFSSGAESGGLLLSGVEEGGEGSVDDLLRSSLQEFMDHMRDPQRSSASIHVVSPEAPEMYSPLADAEISHERPEQRAVVVVCGERGLRSTLEACRALL